jgi:8-oxo-dGTP diphosphatase
MPLYLVRHAKAGDRATWSGDDRVRPLTLKGHAQAQALVDSFAGREVARVLSSPYVRCRQTVEPLARSRGLTVEPCSVLAEASSFLDVVALLTDCADHTVVCSHGDVIPETMAALVRRGLEITTAQDWRKGATWVIERQGGEFTRAAAWPPPADS